MLAVNIVCFDRIRRGFRGALEFVSRPLRLSVSRSFSIYLYQAPLMFFLGALTQGMSSWPLRTACLAAGTIGLAVLLAGFTERRRASVEGWLGAVFAAPVPAVAGSVRKRRRESVGAAPSP